MKKYIIFLTLFVVTATMFSQTTWSFDNAHAKLGFSTSHMTISNVDGYFKNFDAKLQSNKDDFSDAVIEVNANINSINTDNEMRDKDLQNKTWFDAEKFPTLTFKSTTFKKQSGKNYKLSGNITIHGVTKPIIFEVVYNGTIVHPYTKKSVSGFTIKGKLNRKDFAVGADVPDMIVNNEIELISNVEFVKN